MFVGFFALPAHALLQGMAEAYCAGVSAIFDASAAIPAFLGIQDDRNAAIFWVGNDDVFRAQKDAEVTTVADIGGEDDGAPRCRRIGRGIDG
jgi:hypothetical protein